MLSDRCPVCPVLSVCLSVTLVYCWTNQDETWHAGRPRPWPHCVRWGQLPLPKGAQPQFSAHICCGEMAAWIKMSFGMEIDLGPGDIVLDGDPAPPSPQRGRSPTPQFSAHFYCGQMAGCIKMPLGIEVGPSPSDFVLDGDPTSSPKRGAAPPIFGPRLLWPNGCMDQDATWCGGRPLSTRHCVRWERSFPSPKGAQPPIFSQCPLWPNGWMD